jgi:putative ABC transport system permease protein
MGIPPLGTILVHGWAPDSYLREHLVHLQEVDLDPENSVLLGETAADLFSLRAGDTLEIGGEVLPIRAVFRSPAMNENFCAILPIELLGKLLGRENRANYLNIRLEPDVDRASQADLAREIEKNHPELRVFLASEMALDNPGVRIARAMSVAIGLLALAIASIGVASAALAASLERTKENALLLAMGWSPARIGGLVVAEAVLIAGMGSALGILLGISCMLLPSLVPALNLPIAPVIPPLLPLGLWCGNVFLAALCALPPAIGAVKKADASWLQK